MRSRRRHDPRPSHPPLNMIRKYHYAHTTIARSILGAEFYADPLAAGTRPRPHIHRYVENGSPRTRDKFDLFVWRGLEVQSPEGAAAAVKGRAPLGIVRTKPLLNEGIGAEQTSEKALLVFHAFKLYEKKCGRSKGLNSIVMIG